MMTDSTGKEAFPLPHVAEALKPFVRSRQEVLRIRRILSLYLTSHIEGFSSVDLSPISLATIDSNVSVRNIPAHFTGVRKEFLLALQANAKAKQSYAQVEKEIEFLSNRKLSSDNQHGKNEQSAAVSTYLDLFKARRKHEKLTIFQKYTDQLANKVAAQPSYFTLESVASEVGPPPDPLSAIECNESSNEVDDANIRGRVTRLEKALLRANNNLQRENALLAKAKEEHNKVLTSEPARADTHKARIHALHRTHNELVYWMEEQLAKARETEDVPETTAPKDHIVIESEIEQRMEAIQSMYQDYLDVRRSLVTLASRPFNPYPLENLKIRKARKTQRAEEHRLLESDTGASITLPYLMEHFMPAADAQEAHLQQQVHIANALSNQDRAWAKSLERLADESHLLANYPMVASEPPFRNSQVASEESKLHSFPFSSSNGNAEDANVLRQARAWAHAGGAAKSAQDATLTLKLQHGEEHASAAKAKLLDLENLLNSDGPLGEGHEDDIWIEQSKRKGEKVRGIWAGVEGTIGVQKHNV